MSEGVGPFDVEPGRAFEPESDHGEGAWTDREPERADVADVDEGAELHELPPPVPADPFPELPQVTEDQVRDALRAQGALVHGLVAVDKDSTEWVWLVHELDAIAGPLSRIANRFEPLRRVAEHSDVLVVGMSTAAYAKRSIEERAAALAGRQAVAEAEPTGQADFSFQPRAPGARVDGDELDGFEHAGNMGAQR